MLTQIYEISTASEADAISALGVDHLGVLVGDGAFPRERPAHEAAAVLAAIRRPSKSVALFLSADLALIEQMVRELGPAIVHLAAAAERLRPEHVIELRKALPDVLLMRSIPVTGPESVTLASSYDGIVDFLLLDSHREGDTQIGALGITHDWSISRAIVESVRTRVILAGGLGPDNVADAIRAVRPAGVDSKTRTDLGNVAAFNKAAKAVTLM
jgi:phosphoribosylanthranilate isomerase